MTASPPRGEVTTELAGRSEIDGGSAGFMRVEETGSSLEVRTKESNLEESKVRLLELDPDIGNLDVLFDLFGRMTDFFSTFFDFDGVRIVAGDRDGDIGRLRVLGISSFSSEFGVLSA